MQCSDRWECGDGSDMLLEAAFVTERICRITFRREGDCRQTGLNRYGFILDPDECDECGDATASAKGFVLAGGRMTVAWDRTARRIEITDHEGRRKLLQVAADISDAGAVARFEADPDEDWLGFGDQTRDRLYHRGFVADCHVRNVKSYAPVPFFMSTHGVGVLVNTTHRIAFDMCRADAGHFEWRDGRCAVDYYVIIGDSFRDLLDGYTELTGRPRLPPVWSFGLWYICRTQANDHEVVSDAVNFRRERIPCDVIGLEPGWMEKNYDGSTTKQWSNDRFPIPRYALTGPHNFFNALNRMGFHMELWLCCDYDLSFEAERRIGNPTPGRLADDNSAFFHPDGELDEHFSTPRFLDSVTKPDEPWFEHLKAFVDQGADFFKQDGAYQVLDHPDRRWGNGMSDREMHNLYPLLYARQMLEGFEEHTGRRGLTFTPCGWTGFQAWAGTWTGDTGGGPKTIGAMLNTAVVGHSWATNDMEVTQKEALHFGYLLPWAQINSWNYFRMPWIQGDELLEAHRTYSQFRARLIPYIYSWAYHATQTGFPLIAPLTLDFQDDPACKDILLQFLLGRDLMVCAFTDEAYFPEGMWYDMWSGELVDGRQRRNITWPADRGGGLFLRRGGIVPFGPVMQYRGERPVDAIDVLAFPGPKPSHFALYEDDGVSLAHRDGACAVTTIMTVGSDTSAELSVDSPAGCLQVVCPNRTWTARLVVPKEPVAVILDGKAVPVDRWSYDAALRTVAVADVQPPCKVTVRWE